VIIPARDEERAVAQVVAAMPPRVVRSVIVVDNASTDATGRRAEDAGAVVVREARVGYGAACLRGIAHVSSLPRPPDAVVFLSATGSDDPADVPRLIEPLRESLFDLVIGSRVLPRPAADGARTAPLNTGQRAGNRVATTLIKAIYGHRYTDVSPFRAIRYPALIALGLRDPGYGFLVEMQVKALKVGLRIAETPVRYQRAGKRVGKLDTLRGTVRVSAETLFQIFRHSTAR